MPLTTVQTLIILLCITVATQLTRWPAFLLFPEHKEPPKIVTYLGNFLPAAMMGLLVVYCLRGVDFTGGSHGIPEALALAVTVGLHLWKRNVLASIAGGTAVYMALVQLVFV